MELIRRGDAGYDRLRAVFDHRVDRRPAAIARCRSIDDVRAALEFAASHDLPYAVRGGAASERATLDDGLVIDVSPLKGIAVDPDRREAVVAAGVTWAELDAATSTHGLAVTGSRVSWLGVAGVALGEGSGWLERSLGRTGDSVVAVDAAEAPQGAVATALTLRLSPVEPVMLCGFLSFPGSRAREVASVYRDLMEDAPPAVGGAIAVYAGRAGLCQVTFCFLGDVEEGERRLGPLRALGPASTRWGRTPTPPSRR